MAACSDAPAGDVHLDSATGVRLEQVAAGFDAPLYLTAPVGDTRSLVVEQTGRVRIIKGSTVLPIPFLDIGNRISTGGERGLLSIAFHPKYTENGFLYIDYTDTNGDTRIER